MIKAEGRGILQLSFFFAVFETAGLNALFALAAGFAGADAVFAGAKGLNGPEGAAAGASSAGSSFAAA